MASASEVARYIVRYFQSAGDPISNLKLQKLLYYVQGWSLVLRDGQLAFDDRLEAWVHGPVQPKVYGTYKKYRWNPIDGDVEEYLLPDELKRLADAVLETYGTESAYELEVRTHREAPWRDARGNLAPDEDSNSVISADSMKRFFKALSERDATE